MVDNIMKVKRFSFFKINMTIGTRLAHGWQSVLPPGNESSFSDDDVFPEKHDL